MSVLRDSLSVPTVGFMLGVALAFWGLALLAPWLALVCLGLLLMAAAILAAIPRRGA